jgi:putative SOS response-associated peptidase YedK
MCARYTIDADPVRIADLFQLVELTDLPPHYNVAPSRLVPVVGAKPDGPSLLPAVCRLLWPG